MEEENIWGGDPQREETKGGGNLKKDKKHKAYTYTKRGGGDMEGKEAYIKKKLLII